MHAAGLGKRHATVVFLSCSLMLDETARRSLTSQDDINLERKGKGYVAAPVYKGKKKKNSAGSEKDSPPRERSPTESLGTRRVTSSSPWHTALVENVSPAIDQPDIRAVG
eukprot:1159699-Pelagomonas_calceolata.AAC.21